MNSENKENNNQFPKTIISMIESELQNHVNKQQMDINTTINNGQNEEHILKNNPDTGKKTRGRSRNKSKMGYSVTPSSRKRLHIDKDNDIDKAINTSLQEKAKTIENENIQINSQLNCINKKMESLLVEIIELKNSVPSMEDKLKTNSSEIKKINTLLEQFQTINDHVTQPTTTKNNSSNGKNALSDEHTIIETTNIKTKQNIWENKKKFDFSKKQTKEHQQQEKSVQIETKKRQINKNTKKCSGTDVGRLKIAPKIKPQATRRIVIAGLSRDSDMNDIKEYTTNKNVTPITWQSGNSHSCIDHFICSSNLLDNIDNGTCLSVEEHNILSDHIPITVTINNIGNVKSKNGTYLNQEKNICQCNGQTLNNAIQVIETQNSTNFEQVERLIKQHSSFTKTATRNRGRKIAIPDYHTIQHLKKKINISLKEFQKNPNETSSNFLKENKKIFRRAVRKRLREKTAKIMEKILVTGDSQSFWKLTKPTKLTNLCEMDCHSLTPNKLSNTENNHRSNKWTQKKQKLQ
ncbi:hypothetical protein SNEBB_003975 [Seison nebaliae]|nr:hypothetical protein SNEBB_003975 [Seison nebaliae]